MRNALATHYIGLKFNAIFCVNVDKNFNFIFFVILPKKQK